jgi:hypothetical protein
LNFGCGSQDIFSHLLVSVSNDTNGNPKVKAFLEDLIDDHNICRNPLLACDVLLRQCNQSFSNGATGYSRESSSIKWDHLKARPEGIDSMQLAQMVIRAYLQKQGDLTGVTMSNVNNLPAARQEIAERQYICLLNHSNKARGEENSMKFKEYVALANVLVAHGQPAYLASILHTAKFYLHPFGKSRASLYKSAALEKADPKAARTVNQIQTSPKASTPSTVKEAGLIAQVAALQSMQKGHRRIIALRLLRHTPLRRHIRPLPSAVALFPRATAIALL